MRLFESVRHAHAVWFAARINVYAIALTTLWVPLNAVLLPIRIVETVPIGIQASALGTFSFIGIGSAVLIQPIAGRISDLAPFPDRRRPFIVVGTVVNILCLILIWLAPGFLTLLAAYLLLQVSSNFAQAALQALIPDLVSPAERGLAAGVKNAYDVLGGALGLLATAFLLGIGPRHAAVFAFIAAVMALTALLTAVWVPPVPPLPAALRTPILAVLAQLPTLPGAFARDFRQHHAFALTVAVKFLFLLGIYPIQRFFLFFLQDRFGLAGAARATSFYALGAVLLGALGAVSAGPASDRIGRLPMLQLCIGVTVVGILGVAFAPSLLVLAIFGSILSLGFGAFQAVIWALLSDQIPAGRGAQFYGLANVATAGASALAGLFGVVVDAANALVPVDPFRIAFGLAALCALASLLPLQKIRASQSTAAYDR